MYLAMLDDVNFDVIDLFLGIVANHDVSSNFFSMVVNVTVQGNFQ